MKAITIDHMNAVIARYTNDMRFEKNKKASARLEVEQAMFKFVLRRAKQVEVTQKRIRVMHKE